MSLARDHTAQAPYLDAGLRIWAAMLLRQAREFSEFAKAIAAGDAGDGLATALASLAPARDAELQANLQAARDEGRAGVAARHRKRSERAAAIVRQAQQTAQ